MIVHSFKINGDSLQFTLNTKTKQWHIKRNYKDMLILTKAKGEAVIKFLEVIQEGDIS
ncbi:unnamed protein product [marine sediment metagenome]|uniref:Uncharacterized protein n=1 Tax=marine sediment metagenome TaxID=412755 RepID=X1I7L0_9ZZZZ